MLFARFFTPTLILYRFIKDVLVPHTSCLSLVFFIWRTTGLEPANDGVTVHCLTTWLRTPSRGGEKPFQ